MRAAALRWAPSCAGGLLTGELADIDRLKAILGIIEECRTRVATDKSFTTQSFTEVFGQLQLQYREEYALYGLSTLAVAVVAVRARPLPLRYG